MNLPLSLALRQRAAHLMGRDVKAYHTDDGVMLHLIGEQQAPVGLLASVEIEGMREALLKELPFVFFSAWTSQHHSLFAGGHFLVSLGGHFILSPDSYAIYELLSSCKIRWIPFLKPHCKQSHKYRKNGINHKDIMCQRSVH